MPGELQAVALKPSRITGWGPMVDGRFECSKFSTVFYTLGDNMSTA